MAGGAAVVLMLWGSAAWADPEGLARLFVKRVQAGDVAGAQRLFGDPQFRTPPRGGDGAYFVYESGQEPNLAFLVGHPFDIGQTSMRESRSDWYLIDGVLYAYVTIPLSFRPERDQPYLLPSAMAFGRRMPFVAFMNFVVAPDQTRGEFRDFSLRLRPSIEAGLIRPPAPRVAVPPPPVGPPGAGPTMPSPAQMAEMSTSLFQAAPRDPAPVLLPTGEALTTEQLKRLLPRLRAITLEVHLERRGRLAAFGVSSFQFTEAVLATDLGEVRVGGMK